MQMTKKTGDILFFLIIALVAAAFCCMATPYSVPVRYAPGSTEEIVGTVSYFALLSVVSFFSIAAGVSALAWLVALVVSKWRGSDPSPWAVFFSGVCFLSSLFCLVDLIADSFMPWLAIGISVLLAVAFLLQFIRTYRLPHDFKIIFPILWSVVVELLLLFRIFLSSSYFPDFFSFVSNFFF